MSVAAATAREVTQALATGKSRDRNIGSLVFLCLLWFSLFFGVMVLLALIISTAIKGAPRFDTELITNYASVVRPETTGFRAGILGSLWLMVFTALFAVPLGIAAAIYLEEYADANRWWNRLIEINLQNLAAVPSIVYGLLAVAVMALAGFERHRHRARRCGRAGAPDPAGHHHHDPGGAESGAAGHPPRLARARCHSLADDVAADAAVGDPGHRDRHDPRTVPRDR